MLYLNIIIALLTLPLVHYLWRIINQQILSYRHGCAAPFRLPSTFPYTNADFLDKYTTSRRTGNAIAFLRPIFFASPGRTSVTSIWGTPWFFTSHPENIRAIATSQFQHLSVERSRKLRNHYLGDGMFVSDGERWKLSRQLFKPMFARAAVSGLDRVEVHLAQLLGSIPRDGTQVDLQPKFKKFYLDVSSEILLGKSMDSQAGGDPRFDVVAFEKSFSLGLGGMLRRISLGRVWGWLAKRDEELDRHWQFVYKVLDLYIDDVLANQKGDSQGSMLHRLIEYSTDRQFLRNQLLNVLLGAKDTAALGISLLFFHLARHPRVWDKLQEEIKQTPCNAALTWEVLKPLEYVQCVIKESLRLLSPVNLMVRDATEDLILPRGGGTTGQQPILVPKGSRIQMNLTLLHTDESIWGPDVAEFIPERWQTEQTSNLSQWEFIPFSGGNRICPANQMMVVQYSYILVRFLQSFGALENRDAELEFKAQIVFSQESKNGVQVAFLR